MTKNVLYLQYIIHLDVSILLNFSQLLAQPAPLGAPCLAQLIEGKPKDICEDGSLEFIVILISSINYYISLH